MVAAIKRPLPKVGRTFEVIHKGKPFRMQVVKDANGGVAYEVDGHLFRTPTAAARHVTKGEVNGWKFWHMI